jgi:hypothetical protein
MSHFFFILAGAFLGIALGSATPPLPAWKRGPPTPLHWSDMRRIVIGVAGCLGAIYAVALILDAIGV